MSARGLRNNNPGNIRKSKDLFLGEIRPSADKSFKQFENMAYGYRAMFRILGNYVRHYKLDTLEKMITRWAPPKENNTKNYINSVSEWSGVDKDSKVWIDNRQQMCAIVAAMSRMENGVKANMSEVEQGFDLAQR